MHLCNLCFIKFTIFNNIIIAGRRASCDHPLKKYIFTCATLKNRSRSSMSELIQALVQMKVTIVANSLFKDLLCGNTSVRRRTKRQARYLSHVEALAGGPMATSLSVVYPARGWGYMAATLCLKKLNISINDGFSVDKIESLTLLRLYNHNFKSAPVHCKSVNLIQQYQFNNFIVSAFSV